MSERTAKLVNIQNSIRDEKNTCEIIEKFIEMNKERYSEYHKILENVYVMNQHLISLSEETETMRKQSELQSKMIENLKKEINEQQKQITILKTQNDYIVKDFKNNTIEQQNQITLLKKEIDLVKQDTQLTQIQLVWLNDSFQYHYHPSKVTSGIVF